jgi:hypothetical protein
MQRDRQVLMNTKISINHLQNHSYKIAVLSLLNILLQSRQTNSNLRIDDLACKGTDRYL